MSQVGRHILPPTVRPNHSITNPLPIVERLPPEMNRSGPDIHKSDAGLSIRVSGAHTGLVVGIDRLDVD